MVKETFFLVADSPTCQFDKLEVRDWNNGATLCGKDKGKVPPAMSMKGRQIHIEFTSDRKVKESGFLLHYNVTRIQKGWSSHIIKLCMMLNKVINTVVDIRLVIKRRFTYIVTCMHISEVHYYRNVGRNYCSLTPKNLQKEQLL